MAPACSCSCSFAVSSLLGLLHPQRASSPHGSARCACRPSGSAARGHVRARPERAFAGQLATVAGERRSCKSFASFARQRLSPQLSPLRVSAPTPAVAETDAEHVQPLSWEEVAGFSGEAENLDNINRFHSGVWRGRWVKYDPETGGVIKAFDLEREIDIQGPSDTALSPYSTFFASHFERHSTVPGKWKSAQWAHIVDMPGHTTHDEERDPPAPFSLSHRRTPLFLPGGAGAWVSYPFAKAELLLAMKTASGRHFRVCSLVSYETNGALKAVSLIREDAEAWPSPAFPEAAPTLGDEPAAVVAPAGDGFVWPAPSEVRKAELGTGKLEFSAAGEDVFLQDYAPYVGDPHVGFLFPGGVRLYAPKAVSPWRPDQKEGRGGCFAVTLVAPSLEGPSAAIVQVRFGRRGQVEAVVAGEASLGALGQ